MSHLIDLAAIALLVYGLMRSTPTEIREAIQSYLILGTAALVLIIAVPYALLFIAS